jgi:hypothetical protein
VRALVTNPLDWQHFYEMLSGMHHGDKTDFTVVTAEGDRVVGEGDVAEFEKWSDKGRYGFLIKIKIRRQKSLTDRRTRGRSRKAAVTEEEKPRPARAAQVQPVAATLRPRDMSDFKDLLKDSLTMDMST